MEKVKKPWDGVISKMRIGREVCPELFENLAPLHQKDRSDRIRLLAYIGLKTLEQKSLYQLNVNDSNKNQGTEHHVAVETHQEAQAVSEDEATKESEPQEVQPKVNTLHGNMLKKGILQNLK